MSAQRSVEIIYHYFPSEVSGNSHYELYNLADDPFESTNLASERPDVLREQMQRLIASLVDHDALYPVEESGSDPRRPSLP